MTREQIEANITDLIRQEREHRVLAERAAGARQAFELLLKTQTPSGDAAPVREFPVAVPDPTVKTATA